MNLFYLLIIVFLLIAFLLRVDFVFYILYVCAGIFVWARWVVPALLRRVVVVRDLPTHVFSNESFQGRLILTNPTRFPLPWVELNESVALELRGPDTLDEVTSLRGRQKVELTYDLQAKRRGLYQVGPLRLSTGDVFGLNDLQEISFPPTNITVYPRIHPLTRLGIPSRLPFGTLTTPQRLFEDPARPIGVRAFRSGDSLRRINWKVSAHQRQLMAKTFQPAMSLDAAVVLNLTREAYMRQDRLAYIEWAIEIAASLAVHLIDKRQAVGLLTNGSDPMERGGEGPLFDEAGRLAAEENGLTAAATAIPPRNGRAQLMKILERLARLEPVERSDFAGWIAPACHRLSWGTTLLVISPSSGAGLTDRLHQLSRAGLNPILILVNPLAERELADLNQRGRRLGFTVIYLPSFQQLPLWQS